jgi:hypothetical protein
MEKADWPAQGLLTRAQDVRTANEERLMRFPNVVGTGIGLKTVGGVLTSTVCITVFVEKKVPVGELKRKYVIPKELRGVPVDVLEVGHLVSQPALPPVRIG